MTRWQQPPSRRNSRRAVEGRAAAAAAADRATHAPQPSWRHCRHGRCQQQIVPSSALMPLLMPLMMPSGRLPVIEMKQIETDRQSSSSSSLFCSALLRLSHALPAVRVLLEMIAHLLYILPTHPQPPTALHCTVRPLSIPALPLWSPWHWKMDHAKWASAFHLWILLAPAPSFIFKLLLLLLRLLAYAAAPAAASLVRFIPIHQDLMDGPVSKTDRRSYWWCLPHPPLPIQIKRGKKNLRLDLTMIKSSPPPPLPIRVARIIIIAWMWCAFCSSSSSFPSLFLNIKKRIDLVSSSFGRVHI